MVAALGVDQSRLFTGGVRARLASWPASAGALQVPRVAAHHRDGHHDHHRGVRRGGHRRHGLGVGARSSPSILIGVIERVRRPRAAEGLAS